MEGRSAYMSSCCTLCECEPLVVRASDGAMYSQIENATEPEIDL